MTGKHIMYIAEDGSRIVGMVNERGGGRISMMFVDAAYHRRGIATALMNRIVVDLKVAGNDRITLHSSPYGLPFYHHYGFTASDVQQIKDGFIFTPMYYEPKELWDIYDRNRVKTGRFVERGRPMDQDEYHIVVHVWKRNSHGEWLISKRSPDKDHFPNMWECTGGSAVASEDSLYAAIREAKEELGISLLPNKGVLFKSYIRQHHDFPQFTDVWVFEHDCPIENIILQDGETCGAMWASSTKINEMIESGKFLGYDVYPYLDELLK
jgi:8-oxo-dGTP pyrophosphatase MutT (NUDIX family)